MKTSVIFGVMAFACLATMADDAVPPGTFECQLGDATVTTLAERQQSIGTEILIGATDVMLKRYAPSGSVPNAINAFLVRAAGKKILVDTGLGLKLRDNLNSVGVGAGDIDAVLITHMHRDHIGGLLRDGTAVFTNATVYIARREFDYWQQQGDFAQKIAEAYAGRFRLFYPQELDAETPVPLMRGITAFAAYGHTPGHTVFLVEGRTKKLLIWGDLTHATSLQVTHPEVAVTYDVDPTQAIAARQRVIAYVVANKIDYVSGIHLAYPGVASLWQQKATNICYIAPADYTFTNAAGTVISVRSDGYRTETDKVAEGPAKGQVKRHKETHEPELTWWQITDYTYDDEGWPVRSERSSYSAGIEGATESEETVYFPQSKKKHYIKVSKRNGDTHYTVFNERWQVVAYLSGEGKLTKEEREGSEKYWAPLLKGETPDEARTRLANVEREKLAAKATRDALEKIADEAEEKIIAASEPVKDFVFPQAIEEALPAGLDRALPEGFAALRASIKKAHFTSERRFALLLKQLEPFFLTNKNETSVEVTVVDESGQPVNGAQVTLTEIRLLNTSDDINRAYSNSQRSEQWEPMSQTLTVGPEGRAVFPKITRFMFLLLARSLFYQGAMPGNNLRASVKAPGYEDAPREFCNVDLATLALAKQSAAIFASVADDPEIKIEGDTQPMGEEFSSSKLAKAVTVPEENRHETVQVKIVLKPAAL